MTVEDAVTMSDGRAGNKADDSDAVHEVAADERVEHCDIDADRPETTDASVIVVTFNRAIEELRPTLDALDGQDIESYEVVLLDNGTAWDLHALQTEYDAVTAYVAFHENEGVNVARNTGARLANGDLLVFLDDDAVPEPDFVRAHLAAHERDGVVGARGRVLPRSGGIFSWMGPRYDLGEESFAYPLDLEGNVSVDADAFHAVGGFDESIFGHEGLELTLRLVDRYDTSATVYAPDAIVHHDYVDGFADLVEKKTRHGHYQDHLRKRHPALAEMSDRYERYDYVHRDDSGAAFHTKVVLYLLIRLSDLVARVLRARRTFDRPTR